MGFQRFLQVCASLLLLGAPGVATCEAMSLFGNRAFVQDRPALVTISASADDGLASPRVASLFTDQQRGSLFAPLPKRDIRRRQPVLLGPGGSDVAMIRHLIGNAESRRDGYDAVQHGARRLPAKLPTQMTLGEINRWIDATPGQPHAIGRYQFIPVTLRRLMAETGAGQHEMFTSRMQDRLADVLLQEAGLEAVRQGSMGRREFMGNLARIWAGLPTANGRSYYHGFAGNKASMTWDHFDREMAQIFPG